MAKLAISGATILDTAAPQAEAVQKTLVIEDGRILDWTASSQMVDQTINAVGLWAIPGLVDAHLHPFRLGSALGQPEHRAPLARKVQRALNGLKYWLESGVTTIISAGAADNLDIELRDLLLKGEVPGPRIFAAGAPLAASAPAGAEPGRPVRAVAGPDEARLAARQWIKAGVDQIVLLVDGPADPADDDTGAPLALPMDEAEIRAVMEQAEHASVPVYAYAVELESIQNCLRAGVRTLICAGCADEAALADMAAAGVTVVPLLAARAALRDEGAQHGFDPSRLPPRLAATIAIRGLPKLVRTGVRLATGSDAGWLESSLAEECRLLVQAGLSAYEALQAATLHGAGLVSPLHRDFGSLSPGCRADVVLLRANPLADISNLNKVQGVIKDGRLMFWRKEVKPAAISG